MNKLILNNIFIPRRLDEIEEKEKQRLQQLLQQEIIKGDLDLSHNKWIKDLGNIRKIEGSLDLSFSLIQSLGNLEYVGWDLILRNTPIRSLGDLEYVKGYLDLRNSQVKDLGKLKCVEWWIDLKDTPLSKQFSTKKELRQYIKSKIKVRYRVYV